MSWPIMDNNHLDWTSPAVELPQDGEVVQTMNSVGHVSDLKFRRNLWWFPDESMYVYYVPLFWKRKPTGATR